MRTHPAQVAATSIIGLLLGIRHLTLHSGPAEVLHPARRLLIFASLVTLALNTAEPLITGRYGKAAFDAVGPLLLIGWAEVGPGLLHAMQTTPPRINPQTAQPPAGAAAENQPPVPVSSDRRPRAGTRPTPSRSDVATNDARRQDLLHRARAEDVLHWQHHQRPISADTLRKRLHVGAGTARSLVTQLRTNTHNALDSQSEAAR